MTVDSDLRATAYYESGLAVVAWSLNLRVHNVSIRADNVVRVKQTPTRLIICQSKINSPSWSPVVKQHIFSTRKRIRQRLMRIWNGSLSC